MPTIGRFSCPGSEPYDFALPNGSTPALRADANGVAGATGRSGVVTTAPAGAPPWAAGTRPPRNTVPPVGDCTTADVVAAGPAGCGGAAPVAGAVVTTAAPATSNVVTTAARRIFKWSPPIAIAPR